MLFAVRFAFATERLKSPDKHRRIFLDIFQFVQRVCFSSTHLRIIGEASLSLGSYGRLHPKNLRK